MKTYVSGLRTGPGNEGVLILLILPLYISVSCHCLANWQTVMHGLPDKTLLYCNLSFEFHFFRGGSAVPLEITTVSVTRWHVFVQLQMSTQVGTVLERSARVLMTLAYFKAATIWRDGTLMCGPAASPSAGVVYCRCMNARTLVLLVNTLCVGCLLLLQEMPSHAVRVRGL